MVIGKLTWRADRITDGFDPDNAVTRITGEIPKDHVGLSLTDFGDLSWRNGLQMGKNLLPRTAVPVNGSLSITKRATSIQKNSSPEPYRQWFVII